MIEKVFAMPVSSDGVSYWVSPKWLVLAAIIAADGLLVSYDLRLGIAALVLSVAAALAWAYLSLRYGALSGQPSVRSSLLARAGHQAALRRKAADASAAQQGAEPAQRP